MLLVALLCVGLMAGCGQSTDEDKKGDTTKQEQQADNQDGSDKAGYAAGGGDVFITAHFEGEQAVDLDITEEDGVYTAPFAVVPGMTQQGK